MAHNISRLDGTDQAWYADKPAWHGLGTVTVGAKRADQVVKAVPAFRKDVLLAPVYVKIGGKFVAVEDRQGTYRAGTTEVMGIVSTEYEKLSDRDALALLEAVITEAAGRKGKGARGFASIDLTRVFGKLLAVKRDPSRQESFLFGDWTHDGSGALHAGLWNNRVECNNMLDAANAYAGSKGLLATIRHAGDMAAQVAEAQRTLGFAELAAKAHVAEMNALQDAPIAKPKLWLPAFTELVVPTDPEAGDRAARNRQEARDVIASLFTGSRTLTGVPQSAYRAYQAVAEYADHHRPLRIGADTDPAVAADRRFRSIVEGPAADMKSRALELLRQEFLVPVGARPISEAIAAGRN
jgi:phage/plasmid-like protein (TIGR03299 family)